MNAADDVGVVWFRNDLRVDDNPAWAAATSEHPAVVALYVLDPRHLRAVGPFRRRQLVATVQALDFELFERTGGRLYVRIGDPTRVVPSVARAFRARAVHWNESADPSSRRADLAVRAALPVRVRTWWGSLVLPPEAIDDERPIRTFGAFHARWLETPWDVWPEPGDAVVFDEPGDRLPPLDGRALLVEGTAGATERLARLVRRLDAHPDAPHVFDGGGPLSVDLRDGTLSARSVVAAVAGATPARLAALRVLARRDWNAHRLARTPGLVDGAGNRAGRVVAWHEEPRHLSAWKGGFTGFPIVDAGMRELRQTGWMPHRIRSIVAAFFAQGLLLDWRIGERHVRHLLIDGDVAEEVARWQAAAGVADGGRSHRRVANPVTEGRVVDPAGTYIRRWVPELAGLDDEAVHAPWDVPAEVLAAAGVELGRDYPLPIVDLGDRRRRYVELLRAAVRGADEAPDLPVVALAPREVPGRAAVQAAARAGAPVPTRAPAPEVGTSASASLPALPRRRRATATAGSKPGGTVIDLTAPSPTEPAEVPVGADELRPEPERRHA